MRGKPGEARRHFCAAPGVRRPRRKRQTCRARSVTKEQGPPQSRKTLRGNTEGYRSGHNGAVLKTVRAQAHAGSNPAPSAISKGLARRAGSLLIIESTGFEPEGTWQGAGGTLQPEAACPAGQVESCTLRHERNLFGLPRQKRFSYCSIRFHMI